jgi:uncharacterized protein with von Willebrand factor type A (vWA) domain
VAETPVPVAPPEASGPGGLLSENIMHFGRVLRRAGLPIGPGQVLAALNAVEAVGLGSRVDFYWTLHSVFVNRRDQRELFDQAFHIFWRNPDILERMMQIMLPDAGGAQQAAENAEEISRRLAEALNPNRDGGDDDEEEGEEEITFDASLTWSAGEVLRDMDFEKMSSAEVREALDAIRRMRLPIMQVSTRRFRADPSGARIDMRRSLRAALRSGSDYIPLMKRKRRTRHPPLVIICDISGSMERYSRMMLHFMHAITNDRDRVHTFLFGTRLTNVTRYLRYKDVDAALEKVGEAVVDWSGGTRIGHSVHEFNQNWSRRVLTQGAVTVLISDGLDRDEGTGLAKEMERLHKSCRRLIWLNPLLRYEGFEPKSVGIRAILPHVDEFRTIHNLDSMRDLTRVLGADAPRNLESMARWRSAAA